MLKTGFCQSTELSIICGATIFVCTHYCQWCCPPATGKIIKIIASNSCSIADFPNARLLQVYKCLSGRLSNVFNHLSQKCISCKTVISWTINKKMQCAAKTRQTADEGGR